MDGKVELMPLSPAETPVAFMQMAEPAGSAVTIACKLPVNAFGLTSLLLSFMNVSQLCHLDCCLAC